MKQISFAQAEYQNKKKVTRLERGARSNWITSLNGHEPYAYLKDVLERLPTQKASQLHELLPQNWQKPA